MIITFKLLFWGNVVFALLQIGIGFGDALAGGVWLDNLLLSVANGMVARMMYRCATPK